MKSKIVENPGLRTGSMSGYQCMPRPELKEGPYSIIAVQESHIEPIRRWRNAQMHVLRQFAKISAAQQEAYFQTHIWPDKHSPEPKNLLLAILENKDLIGYGGLVHIAWPHLRAEVSFLLKTELTTPPSRYSLHFASFLRLIKTLAFEDLRLERLYTETFAIREHHIAVLESSGFRREGVSKSHVRIDGRPVDSYWHGCLSTYER